MILLVIILFGVVVALISRSLRRRDADGYWDRDWSPSSSKPGLRIDFRRTGRDQRPPGSSGR